MAKTGQIKGDDESKGGRSGKGTDMAKHSATVVLMPQSGRHAAADARADTPAASERRAQGKSLRETVSRDSHAGWKAPKDRRDPIDLLVESMRAVCRTDPDPFRTDVQSPFAFYRGAAAVMAADLATTRAIGTAGAGLRRCASAELRRVRHAGAANRVRHQRSRRDAAGAVGMGRQAADRERRHRRAISPAERDDAARRPRRPCAYRQHMADYASMRALDVWYDTIGIETSMEALDDRHASG